MNAETRCAIQCYFLRGLCLFYSLFPDSRISCWHDKAHIEIKTDKRIHKKWTGRFAGFTQTDLSILERPYPYQMLCLLKIEFFSCIHSARSISIAQKLFFASFIFLLFVAQEKKHLISGDRFFSVQISVLFMCILFLFYFRWIRTIDRRRPKNQKSGKRIRGIAEDFPAKIRLSIFDEKWSHKRINNKSMRFQVWPWKLRWQNCRFDQVEGIANTVKIKSNKV